MAFTGAGKLLKDFLINTLTTTNKTIPGAINELNSKMSKPTAVSNFANIGGSFGGDMMFALYAIVTGTRDTSGIWTVHIHGQITTNTGTSDMFAFGIRLSLLKQALGVTNLDFIGGSYAAYNSGGVFIPNGFAGMLDNTIHDFLRFGRYYKLPNVFGIWPATASFVAVGTTICATAILKES